MNDLEKFFDLIIKGLSINGFIILKFMINISADTVTKTL
jgi:hypothetical protein